MKKIVLLLLMFVLMGSSFVYGTEESQSLEFKDIKQEFQHKADIEKLVKAKVINGYPDGTFRPYGKVTRAEFITMVNKMMNYSLEKQDNLENQLKFKDVEESAWYYKQLQIAVQKGYIKGFEDGTFRASGNITKEQICAIMTRMLNLKRLPMNIEIKDKVSNWAKNYVEIMLSNRIISLDKDGNFQGTEDANRLFAAVVNSKFLVEKSVEVDKGEEIKNSTVSSGTTGSGTNGNSSKEPEQILTEEEKEQLRIEKVKDLLISLEKAKNYLIAETGENSEEVSLMKEIIENLNRYVEDTTYDYKTQGKTIKEKYNKLTEEKQQTIKNSITRYHDVQDLLDAKEYLF